MPPSVLADKPVAQDKLGRARSQVDAARRYLTDRLAAWERVQAGHAPTIEDRGELWLACAHAAAGTERRISDPSLASCSS